MGVTQDFMKEALMFTGVASTMKLDDARISAAVKEWEKVGNWTRRGGAKRGRVSGVLSASL
eukprot:4010751-Pyramimonas_sp.AAC.1